MATDIALTLANKRVESQSVMGWHDGVEGDMTAYSLSPDLRSIRL